MEHGMDDTSRMRSCCNVLIPRSERIESIHRVSVAVVDLKGDIIMSAGDPQLHTYFRSSAKPLQVIPLLEAGGAEAFGFDSRELAVMSASHDGEEIHTDAVLSILSKIGLEEHHLFCGPHDPYFIPAGKALSRAGKAPTSAHNNCSGKHSGMLALSVLNGWPVEGYQLPEHQVQKRIFEVISGATDIPVSSIEYGIDGCGIPTFYLSVYQMAVAYSRFADWAKENGKRGDAVRKLIRAIREEPVMLEGTTGFSSALAAATDARVIGKVGGEGLFCIAVPEEGIGLALKVEDGNRRATSPAAVELLRTMKLISGKELECLSDHHSPVLYNHQGTEIGKLKSEIILER
jgi:L-asparaginase II